MLIDEDGQGVPRPFLGETGLVKEVLQMTFQNFLLHRQAIGEWAYLAKQFSFHFLGDMLIVNYLNIETERTLTSQVCSMGFSYFAIKSG